jgi:hypothetical protein
MHPGLGRRDGYDLAGLGLAGGFVGGAVQGGSLPGSERPAATDDPDEEQGGSDPAGGTGDLLTTHERTTSGEAM